MEVSIFSPGLVKGLTDKIYDRRKAAALEIERLVRENEDSKERITQIVDALVQEFVYSNNPYARYGGLIGLAATSIALGSGVSEYLNMIVPPILSCFSNQDQKVRYYACESMYNIAKVAKGEVLRYFNSIFDALCKLSADSEISVKNGAELLDRLIKDIVSELSTTYVSPYNEPLNTVEAGGEELDTPSSLPRNTAFSLPRFIPLLSQRIYVRNSNARQFLVSWMCVLDSIPDLELISFLPEFLDGLIRCLNDVSEDVRVATSGLLQEFLNEIKEAAAARELQLQQQEERKRKMKQEEGRVKVKEMKEEGNDKDGEEKERKERKEEGDEEFKTERQDEKEEDALIDSENDGHGKGTYVPGQGVIVQYGKIVEILVPHLSSSEEDIQRTALLWINEFIEITKDVIIQYTPEIIKAVLPSLAHTVTGIRNIALETNQNLQKLVLETPIHVPEPITSKSDPSGGTQILQQQQQQQQQKKKSLMFSRVDNDRDPFDYQTTVANLRLQFLNQHEETRIASLDWLLMLHKKAPNKILASDDGTFPALLKTLSDSSEEVVRKDLQLLAQISFYSDHSYFRSFIMSLLSLFSTDRRLLETRGSLIIRQLCMSLDPERIYCTIADILEQDEDLEFASTMVQNLNIILITASELTDLRKRLRNLDSRENQRLFNTLYRSWCHNAVSTFSLCLLSQVYEHAANMLQIFAELDITVNMLIQIDKLVQLLESPVFTYLRLQLLEPEKYPYLFKCLYGILMLLPQSSAFSTLRNRLNSVSSLGFLHVLPKSPVTSTISTDKKQLKTTTFNSKNTEEINTIKYQDLLTHFKNVQSRHETQRREFLQTASRTATTQTPSPNTGAQARSRRSRIIYNDGNNYALSSNNQQPSSLTVHHNKGAGLALSNTSSGHHLSVGTGGIRNGIANLSFMTSTAGSNHDTSMTHTNNEHLNTTNPTNNNNNTNNTRMIGTTRRNRRV
ncbi:vacuolar protein 14 C-terminal Fig4p binding-domain-containing protein [Cokeromyces recurvatus]|uniref:vacuolar protein 14 C-terminal Fig4p binding-domain-containing protein n=1 Tax=Cokeromyces recurvatus TaxID=90255 RepID=UPI00222032C2|nr:vacuolar protein 14 C-terminal Fig4p binding-domain-containing protein [Cokeromyces recurvatus]KAI7899299.1 vacuolar protein 14 C-terminal Fig4p binding-domain-containing protein [Cokeromyces recurvatus]